MANSFRSKYVLSSLIITIVIISDQLSKAFFTSICNTGVAFSFLESLGRVNILLSFVVLVFVAYFLIIQQAKLQIIAVSLVLAGGLSNLIDRVVIGCVRDFIDLKFWPSFNFADSAITTGIAIFIFKEVFKKR